MRRGFAIAVLVAIGFLLGVFAIEISQNYFLIKFDPKLSLGDITIATTTLLIAVLVTNYLEKHNQTERIEKDLLLRKIELIFPLIQDFEKSNERGTLTEIQSSLKRINVSCNSFKKCLHDLTYPQNILVESDFDSLIREVRRLATDTPIQDIENLAKRARCNSSVKNGIISLTTDRKALLEGKIDEMKSKLLRIQVGINRK